MLLTVITAHTAGTPLDPVGTAAHEPDAAIDATSAASWV
jgi:hypothetical protein